jgi:AcrR family transcriptional regulator
MSPRPRKASDEEVFAAAVRLMSRLGPHEITLADIAGEAGITASALVQRFGSKRALLLTLAEQFAASTATTFAGLASRSPLATIRAYGRCLAGLGPTADALAHNLAWLQQDLADPDFRRHMLQQARDTRRELERLVREAVTAGELIQGTNPAALARAIEITIGGSLMAWAVYQEGTSAAWIAHDLEMLLGPYLPRRPRARRGG